MKKYFLSLIGIATVGLLLTWSCSNNNTSPNNFQGPVTTIVGINPTLSPTLTFTPTPTPSSTPTNTPTTTSTPYAVSTWTGFNAPAAVAVDASGNVYVADTGNNRVEKFSGAGVLSSGWGSGGLKGAVSITAPTGVAVDGSGKLYVTSGNQVILYTATGAVSNAAFSGAALSSTLKGISVNSAGTTVAVADTGNNLVVILDGAGVSQTSYPVTSPSGVAVDGSGNVFASTGTNNTVLELYSSSVTIPGFNNPQGLFTDISNNLWVADKGSKQIEEFAPGATTGLVSPPLVIFNASGTLNTPSGVAVDGSGNVYVADTGANAVVKFAP